MISGQNYDLKRDFRYRIVKGMLARNELHSLQEMFFIIPRTIVARDLHKNNNRMKVIMNNPGLLTINDIEKLALLLRYDDKKLYMFLKQLKKEISTGNTE